MDDADDDYFTPAPNASLASIFQEKSKVLEKSDNNSLKYVAPKPVIPVEETKAECIYACALTGFEWFNNVYTQKGTLGFAIIKTSNSQKIVLYDANKSTLSSTNITAEFKIKVKENVYISYFDDARKYWSLYGNTDQLDKILKILKKLDVDIDRSSLSSTDTEPSNPLIEQEDNCVAEESDTVTPTNKKTKASIISRMANMGHSILPPPPVSADKTSDSSDAGDTQNTSRHKLPKQHQRSFSSQNSIELLHNTPTYISPQDQKIEKISTNNYVSQFLPIACGPSTSEVNTLMTEQRMNNSEIRMNMGRMSDKIDKVINKLSELENSTQKSSSLSNISNNIYLKLLNEYENKIRYYENVIETNCKTQNTNLTHLKGSSIDETDIKASKESFVKKVEIANSFSDSLSITELSKSEINKLRQENNLLTQEITDMKQLLSLRDKTNDEDYGKKRDDITPTLEDIVKSIMNDTFQNVSEKFDDDLNYSGNVIKSVLGGVMKKVTIDVLNKNNKKL